MPRDDGVHVSGRAGNCIDGTCRQAQRTSDATRLVDQRDGRGIHRLKVRIECYNRSVQQCRERIDRG
jgi:hypothetical protein